MSEPTGSESGRDRPFRLAVLNSHPIQYFAPLYRRLSMEPDIDLTVYYCSLQGAHEYVDPDFRTSVQWDIPLLEGYRWKVLPNLRPSPHIAGFWSLINPAVIAELRRERYDALWVHGHGYATHLMAILAARGLGTPVLMRGETHLLLRRSRWKRATRAVLMRLLYNNLCSACLPIGSRNRDFYLAHGVPSERQFLVPYAVDNAYFVCRSDEARSQRAALRAELDIPNDKVVILFAAKLTPRKRPMDLLQAYAEVRAADPRAALLIVGSGEEESSLRSYVAARAVPDVHFAGFRNQTELPGLYAVSDVFVLPSDNEPWGLAINEAMCAGLAIVATDEIGATADLVHRGENGFLYPAGNVAALAVALRSLVADHDLRRRMGTRSREIIRPWGFDSAVDGVRSALLASSRKAKLGSSGLGHSSARTRLSNFSAVPSASFVGRLLRLPLRMLPPDLRLPILQGPMRGIRWIVGAGNHGCWLGSYEYEKCRAFAAVVAPGDVVFDIGAHAGYYTLLASRLVGPRGRVIAFEPLPANIAMLREHLRINRTDNAQVVEAAVTDHGRAVRFAEGAASTMGHIDNRGPLTVPAVSIDDLVSSQRLPPPDCMKVDVEGAEASVLRGADDILRTYGPTVLLAVHSEEQRAASLAQLYDAGYRVTPLDSAEIEGASEFLAQRSELTN